MCTSGIKRTLSSRRPGNNNYLHQHPRRRCQSMSPRVSFMTMMTICFIIASSSNSISWLVDARSFQSQLIGSPWALSTGNHLSQLDLSPNFLQREAAVPAGFRVVHNSEQVGSLTSEPQQNSQAIPREFVPKRPVFFLIPTHNMPGVGTLAEIYPSVMENQQLATYDAPEGHFDQEISPISDVIAKRGGGGGNKRFEDSWQHHLSLG